MPSATIDAAGRLDDNITLDLGDAAILPTANNQVVIVNDTDATIRGYIFKAGTANTIRINDQTAAEATEHYPYEIQGRSYQVFRVQKAISTGAANRDLQLLDSQTGQGLITPGAVTSHGTASERGQEVYFEMLNIS